MFNIRQFLGLGYYESEADHFLAELNKKYHHLSASQQAEIKKYQRIYDLRDNETSMSKESSFWDNF